MTLATKFNPEANLRSNLENSPAPALKRLQALLMLRNETIDSYSRQIDMGYSKLLRLLKGLYWDETEAGVVADGVGLEISDIWPDAEADQEQAA